MKTLATILIILVLINDTMSQWEQQNSSTSQSLRSVCFTDINNGYAVGESMTGDGIILKTTDEGTNWGQQVSDAPHPLNWVHFLSADTGFAVGDSGIILMTTNGGGYYVVRDDFNSPSEALTIYPNPASNKINLTTRFQGDLYLLNHAGREILHQTCGEPETQIDISHLPHGHYIVKVVTKGVVQVGKFIKE